jgi:hypothetical protein
MALYFTSYDDRNPNPVEVSPSFRDLVGFDVILKNLILVMKILIIVSSIAFMASALLGAQEVDKDSAKLSLEIVATISPQKGIPIIDCASQRPEYSGFNVILKNQSDQNLSIWREWCSWGYECLKFEITLEDGTVFTIAKKPIGYDKNYPDPFLVAPNKSFVFHVNFNDGKWDGFPKEWKNQNVKIKAIFTVASDEESKKLKVWSGKTESAWMTVTLYK